MILFSLTSLAEDRLLTWFDMNATRDHYISSTFLAVSLFLLFLSLKQSKVNVFSKLGEKDSLYIHIPPVIHDIFFCGKQVFVQYVARNVLILFAINCFGGNCSI